MLVLKTVKCFGATQIKPRVRTHTAYAHSYLSPGQMSIMNIRGSLFLSFTTIKFPLRQSDLIFLQAQSPLHVSTHTALITLCV